MAQMTGHEWRAASVWYLPTDCTAAESPTLFICWALPDSAALGQGVKEKVYMFWCCLIIKHLRQRCTFVELVSSVLQPKVGFLCLFRAKTISTSCTHYGIYLSSLICTWHSSSIEFLRKVLYNSLAPCINKYFCWAFVHSHMHTLYIHTCTHTHTRVCVYTKRERERGGKRRADALVLSGLWCLLLLLLALLII